jgi:hypothetical protein
MIAATATVYGLTVVTRNTRDFEGLGVGAFNPFDASLRWGLRSRRSLCRRPQPQGIVGAKSIQVL